jgi:CHAT domain-containing protein
MLGDLRFAVRSLLRHAGTTTVAVLSLALGMMATTAIYSAVHAVVLDREALVRDVERVRTAMELRTPEASYLPTLEKLYDQLIRPIQPRLGNGETTLAIVADGELTALPMNALRDRDRGRYLFEDHPIRFAGSLRDPVLEAAPPAAGRRVPRAAGRC